MEQDDFLWFQNWCKIHDDKGWKYAMRVQLATLDNPGWSLKVNLEKTILENQKFQKIRIDRTDNDWIFCAIKENRFEVACGPINLPEVFQIFRKWAEEFLDQDKKDFLEKNLNTESRFIEKSELTWLQYWFYIHCDGDWEHASGIKIELLDNSKWLFKINLKETELENEVFQNVDSTHIEAEEVACRVKDPQFEATCGLTKLNEVIKLFRSWAECFLKAPDRKYLQLLKKRGLHFMEYNDFEWLQKWYYIHCDGKWEQVQRIRLEAIDTPGWLLIIDVQGTELEGKPFRAIRIDKSDDEWVECDVRDDKFKGKCGPMSLLDLLEVFHNWTKPY